MNELWISREPLNEFKQIIKEKFFKSFDFMQI